MRKIIGYAFIGLLALLSGFILLGFVPNRLQVGEHGPAAVAGALGLLGLIEAFIGWRIIR